MKTRYLIIPIAVVLFNGCKKDEDNTSTPVIDQKETEKNIIDDFASVVVNPNYSEIHAKADTLRSRVNEFIFNPTDGNLINVQNAWREVRAPWESCEGFLFGPVEDFEYDPKIDTWPLNTTDMDALLASNNPLTSADIDSLSFSLKGFHSIEYIIFGVGGTKTAAQITSREMVYLASLTENLFSIATDLQNSWLSGGFTTQWTTAGAGSTYFATRKAAFVALVTSMIGICEEVGEGKMQEPLVAQDSSLQESQFSHNSTTDFKNNITGVRNAYLGMYNSDGHGLNELVALKNSSLDQKIQSQLNAAINGFDQINSNYGLAIFTQVALIHQQQAAIALLKTTLQDELIPGIQIWVTE